MSDKPETIFGFPVVEVDSLPGEISDGQKLYFGRRVERFKVATMQNEPGKIVLVPDEDVGPDEARARRKALADALAATWRGAASGLDVVFGSGAATALADLRVNYTPKLCCDSSNPAEAWWECTNAILHSHRHRHYWTAWLCGRAQWMWEFFDCRYGVGRLVRKWAFWWRRQWWED